MTSANLPPPFRLVVKCNGEQKRQGTGWFATKCKVITAWHVVKDMPPSAIYELEVAGRSIPLTYTSGSEDRRSDVAVLYVSETERPRIRDDMVLTLADHIPERNARWFAKGFPARRDGKEQTAAGTVSEPSVEGERIQLTVEQGTQAPWAGSSGAALMVDDKVAGILTDESTYPDFTLYAAPYTAVEAVVPELKGRAHRLAYLAQFRAAFRPPDWCRSYAPTFTVNEETLDPDKLGAMIAKRDGCRVWLIVGSDAEGRAALLRRVADALVQTCSLANEDYLDLPVWCTSLEPDSVAPLNLIRKHVDGCKGIDERDVEQITADVLEATKSGRALYIVDGADAAEVDCLRKSIIGTCTILAGVSEDAPEKLHHVQRCRVNALADADRKRLAAHWFIGEQTERWISSEQEFLPMASKPLDVLIWGRAQLIFERVSKRDGEKLEAQITSSVDLLKELLDSLIGGAVLAEHLRASGVQGSEKEDLLECLAQLAYLTLVDGVEEIHSAHIFESAHYSDVSLPDQAMIDRCLAQASMQCGLLQKTKGNGYRFTHAALQEYLASTAMCGATMHSTPMAEHAFSIYGDNKRISKWSRALALRLDAQVDDAKDIIGIFLNYGLPRGYGTQLRNKSGKLSNAVCQAILHTDRLVGERLREALGWLQSPDDWTGYRPDEWRTIEEILRYLDGLAVRVPDDESLALLLARMLRNAKVIDIALIRYSLAKELRRRKQNGVPSKMLEELFERRHFFEIAGHSIHDCEKVGHELDFQVVPEGWFFMGATEAEERSWPNERPRHRVRLGRYWMSRNEVTNDQYEIFDPAHKSFQRPLDPMLGGNVPTSRGRHLVVRVSWYEAWCFAEWMGMSLPTEAQWEKAARGENYIQRPKEIPQDPMPFWFPAEAIASIAWFNENSRGSGTKEVDNSTDTPFEHKWGLGGLCGNVWEWCLDMQGRKYSEADQEFPEAYPDASESTREEDVINNRMIRSGSYDSPWWNCRHAVRHFTFPTVRADTIGFRLCCNEPPRWRMST